MLASPLNYTASIFSPSHNPEDPPQYRPARDLEAFNNLLPPAIEFIEGSSSGALAVPEGKYEPINTTPKASKIDHSEKSKPPSAPAPTPVKSTASLSASLHSGGLPLVWPSKANIGSGLYNTGNSCFLNSALQCLLHTPPLLNMILLHTKEACRVSNNVFCMTCALRIVALRSHASHKTSTPSEITNRLQTIAKHMRKGRQEDSHEFLRYAIDALQKSCLAGYSPKIDPKLAETTWIHKIFGGKLRSRVTCQNCHYNSDTFDSILDLSLDIYGAEDLRKALRKFVAVDHLKGADKYKCEKCKKAVVAEKQFTIHDAPVVLTVHLKRFSPLGRKVGHHVQYDERLSLKPFMSEGQFGPTYSLYGVICHAGSGPNSGHYFAYVKSKDSGWYEMNDESVTAVRLPPIGMKNAYMLFYLQDKGQGLEAAVNNAASTPALATTSMKAGIAAGMKKRKMRVESDDEGVVEDKGVSAKPFIGPRLPSTSDESDSKRHKPNPPVDPQAHTVKMKIEAASSTSVPKKRTASALDGLSGYTSNESDSPTTSVKLNGQKTPQTPITKRSPSPTALSTSNVLPVASTTPVSIPSISFYNTPSTSGKKRKSLDDRDNAYKAHAREREPVTLSQSTPRKKSYVAASNPFREMVTPSHAKKYKSKSFKRLGPRPL